MGSQGKLDARQREPGCLPLRSVNGPRRCCVRELLDGSAPTNPLNGSCGWLPAPGTRGFHRPLSDPSTDLQVRCHGSEPDGRDVPTTEVATTRLPVSNWSSGRSYLCNGDAGDREQPTDNQLWGHTVAKEQHARNQGEHRKQQAEWCDAAHGTTGNQPEPRRRSRSHGLRSGIPCSSRSPLQLVRYCAVSRPGRSTAAR
jgi:hypothetical protein